MSIELQDPAQFPRATGNETFCKTVVMAGASQAASVPKWLPSATPGQLSRLAVNAPGRPVTLADCFGGILFSSGAGQTVLLLPNTAVASTVNVGGSNVTYQPLGYTMDPANPLDLGLLLQRCGTGVFNIQPVDASVVINYNGIDLTSLLPDHPPVRCALLRTVAGVDYWSLG